MLSLSLFSILSEAINRVTASLVICQEVPVELECRQLLISLLQSITLSPLLNNIVALKLYYQTSLTTSANS